MQRRIVSASFAAAALGLCVVSVPRALETDAVAGDAKVADSLFKSGKQALSKSDFEGAIAFFKKAQEETPELIEACWWRASAQEKSGDKGAALASYREYLTLYDGKFAGGAAMSKEEQRLKGLAEKSVDALAAGEKEFRKLEDGYVAALLAFAKDNFVRDPGVSLKAVQAILAVRPDHDEALKLNEKLGGSAPNGAAAKPAGKGGPGPETGPFAAVKKWHDLISDKSFQGSVVTFGNGLMLVDTKEGTACEAASYVETGKDYALEMEFRVATAYDPSWNTGLGFAWKKNDFDAAMVLASKVVLTHYNPNGKYDDLAEMNGEGIDASAWHRFGIIVKGPSVEVWFDGKKAVSWTNPQGDLAGDVVIMQQRCRTEWRMFHIGKLD